MKRILLILAVIILVLNSSYAIAFPDTWYCLDEQRSWGPNPNGHDEVSLNMAKYYLDGDTTINDMTYSKLF
ncbi:MAG: hypothetical protein IJS05_05605 [Paludibacteraceae bacterium]|nr:hypothetical protein [Paludibacteraceae bacterium]